MSRHDIRERLMAFDKDTTDALTGVADMMSAYNERWAGSGSIVADATLANTIATVALARAVRAHQAFTADGLHEVADAIVRSSRTNARDTGWEREQRMRDRLTLSRDLEALARSIVVAAHPPRPSANERIRAARRGGRIS